MAQHRDSRQIARRCWAKRYRYGDSNPGFRRERALVGLMTSADVVHLQGIPQIRGTPADVEFPADVCQECVRDPRNQSFDGLAAEHRGRTAVSPDWPESQRRIVPARATISPDPPS